MVRGVKVFSVNVLVPVKYTRTSSMSGPANFTGGKLKRLLCFLLVVPALVLAGTITHDLVFSPAELHFSRYNGYDVVELARGHLIPDPGKPCIPEVTVTLVVPAHARVISVDVLPVRTRELAGTCNLVPCQLPRPISTEEDPEFVQPDPDVYSSSALFPAKLHHGFTTGNASGFRLVSVSVFPLQYQPDKGKLFLHTRLRVTVCYDDNAPAPTVLAPNQRDRAMAGLRRLVTNPEDLDRFGPFASETDQLEIDYLVITGDQLAAEFEPFLEYRTGRGLRTEMRTVEWVDRNYPGRDLQEKIRNLVKDYYEHRGLSYVLLAGDNGIVPCRKIRVWVGNTRGDIPTDLYYADLDYSWDSNHNNLFGEMSDSVDLYADIILGRASVDNAAEVRTFISKTKTYEQNPATDYIKRSLLPSGWLWRSIGYHGRVVNDSIANQTPPGWTDIKMEDPPNASVVADSFNHGFAIFDPAGHGNEGGIYCETGTAIYTGSLARSQTNDRRFTIMTSLACNPGNFEAEDCLAELGHNAPNGGCIAVMMNSRYGWGTPPSMGPSEKLCIRFYDFLLNRSEYVIGNCHSRSREEYANSARYSSLWRWCMTEFNLLGDPSLDIWTEAPGQLSLSCPDSIQSGVQNLEITVTGSGPVANARVCVSKGSETYATGLTNSSGRVTLEIHPVTPGTLRVFASCHNFLPAHKDVKVFMGAPEPLIAFLRAGIDDQGQPHPNGILEPGETGRLNLVVLNTGTAQAGNATVTIRPLGTGISIPDSIASFGTIPAGDTAATSDLIVTAEPDIFPGSNPEILAHVCSDENEWEFCFSIQIGYPGRVTAEIDTGACALTLTARGAIGFDNEGERNGRGFRFPKSDTSSLNIASFCLGNSADYVADRFYVSASQLDQDWVLSESLYIQTPIWNSRQLLRSSFTDAGHPSAKSIWVIQRGLGLHEPGSDNFVILVYDVVNTGSEPVDDLYAGILADFDVIATDRLHDLAYTSTGLRTAYMRNVNLRNRYCGAKLLYPDLTSYLACLDHSLYVYPDSGLNESMKFRALKGELGVSGSDRPYNWSVVVSTGPFNLGENGGRQRLAFAFIGAADSSSYLDACQNCQDWFDNNVGIAGPGFQAVPDRVGCTAQPNPFCQTLDIRFNALVNGPVRVQAFDPAGRRVANVYSGRIVPGQVLHWSPGSLPAGVYIVRVQTPDATAYHRVALVR